MSTVNLARLQLLSRWSRTIPAVIPAAVSATELGRAADRITPTEVVVACPVLSEHHRSSLEARARAELAMKRVAGCLQVTCRDRSVRVEFGDSTVAPREREQVLAASSEGWVEQILALIHEVTTESEASNQETSRGTFPTEASRPEPPLQPAPAKGSPLRQSRPAASPAVALGSERAPDELGRHSRLELEPGIGACAELWPDPWIALLGACASFGIEQRPYWRLAPTVSLAWSGEQPHGIAIQNATGGIEAGLGERWWAAAAISVSWTRFAGDAELTPRTQTAVEPTLAARVGYSFVLRRQRLAASLGVRLHPEYRDVRVDRHAVSRVPLVALTLSTEYRFAL